MDHNDKKLFLVWLYDECDILSNVLNGLVHFKKSNKEYWPSSIVLRRGNRLDFGLGDDVRTNFADWPLLDAIYFSLYKPLDDAPAKREPTIFKSRRKSVQDVTGKIFRERLKYNTFDLSDEEIIDD